MGSKNIEEKFNVKISYSLENSEKKTENTLHKTLQDRQANRCRLRERFRGVIKKGVKVFFMDESGISHDPSRVRRLLGLIIQVLMFSLVFPCLMVSLFLCSLIPMLILGFSLIFFTCLGLGILVMSC